MSEFEHDQERAVGMLLADRTYLYSLLHVVFGALPTGASVEAMFGPEAVRVADNLRQRLAESDNATISRYRLDASGLSLAESLDEACASISKSAEHVGDEDFIDKLRSEYTRLFQVPGELFVRPWESPYVGKEEMLFQESTLDVRGFYHAAGFKLKAEKHFPDDHIAAMMEYLARLSQRAFDAYADGVDDEADALLATQREFINKHVLTWIKSFTNAVLEKGPQTCYAAFSLIMFAFVNVDCRDIERLRLLAR